MQLLIQAEGTSEIDRQRGISAARRVFERGNSTASECALAASQQAAGNPGTSRLAALWKDAEKAGLAASCEQLTAIPPGACLELRFGDLPKSRRMAHVAQDLAFDCFDARQTQGAVG